MSIFVKRLLGVMFFISIVSFVVAFVSTIIFVFDMNGAKGLIPLIFFCLMLYFLLSFSNQVVVANFINEYRSEPVKNANLILGIVSAIVFFLSLFVFWL